LRDRPGRVALGGFSIIIPARADSSPADQVALALRFPHPVWRGRAASAPPAKLPRQAWQKFLLQRSFGAVLAAPHLAAMVRAEKRRPSTRHHVGRRRHGGNHAGALSDTYALLRAAPAAPGLVDAVLHLRAIEAVHRADPSLYTCRAAAALKAAPPLPAGATPRQILLSALHAADAATLTRSEAESFAAAFRGAKRHLDNPGSAIDYVGYIGGRTASPLVREACIRYLDAVDALLPDYAFTRVTMNRARAEIAANTPEGGEPVPESAAAYALRRARILMRSRNAGAAEDRIPGMRPESRPRPPAPSR
jgi:hypothetical protein